MSISETLVMDIFGFLQVSYNWQHIKKEPPPHKQMHYAVIPRLTSDPANEDFFAVFWTRLTNMDSANKCFSGCAR